MISFGLKDYINMFKHRGIKLPIIYFIENHLFDIKRGTDTHKWLPKENFQMQSEHLENGVLYMCSWSSIVKSTFNFVKTHLGNHVNHYTFIDVGCGKGKVLILWHELLRKYQLNINIVGIDYYDHLSNIATKNFESLFNKKPNLIIADILDVDLDNYGDNLCFYLYNPFDQILMKKFIDRLNNKNIMVIYNNPQHKDLFIDHGFNLLKEVKHWHYNGNYVILERKSLA